MSCLKPIHAASTFVFSTLLFATAAQAHQHLPAEHNALEREALLEGFGWDVETAEIRTEKIADGLYVLFGLGGNIAVSVGTDGVLIVDDQLPELADKIKAAIAELGSGDIAYVVNTHWHFDHADGNNALGPDGVTIISHDNARSDMADGGIINMVMPNIIKRPTRKRRYLNSPISARCLCTSTEGRLSCDTFLMRIPMAIRRCFFGDTTLCTLGMFLITQATPSSTWGVVVASTV